MTEYLESFRVLPTSVQDKQRVEIKTDQRTYVDVWDMITRYKQSEGGFVTIPVEDNIKKWCEDRGIDMWYYYHC